MDKEYMYQLISSLRTVQSLYVRIYVKLVCICEKFVHFYWFISNRGRWYVLPNTGAILKPVAQFCILLYFWLGIIIKHWIYYIIRCLFSNWTKLGHVQWYGIYSQCCTLLIHSPVYSMVAPNLPLCWPWTHLVTKYTKFQLWNYLLNHILCRNIYHFCILLFHIAITHIATQIHAHCSGSISLQLRSRHSNDAVVTLCEL